MCVCVCVCVCVFHTGQKNLKVYVLAKKTLTSFLSAYLQESKESPICLLELPRSMGCMKKGRKKEKRKEPLSLIHFILINSWNNVLAYIKYIININFTPFLLLFCVITKSF